MKFCQAKRGRTFILRLEDGEILHEVIEEFARRHNIQAGYIIVVGGADKGSTLVVGPENEEASPIPPLTHRLEDVSETAGVGTLFPDEEGNPLLHVHLACGREDRTVTGCGRTGLKVWKILEIILVELTDTEAFRKFDPVTGFSLLEPEKP